MIVEHNNFLVGWLIIKSIEDNPIFNSHLQLIHNSRFHSSQTQFNCTSQFQIHSHHNSFHGINILGVRKRWYTTTDPCEIAINEYSTNILNNGMFVFVRLECFLPLENFSLIWRRHYCRSRAANFDLCSTLKAH